MRFADRPNFRVFYRARDLWFNRLLLSRVQVSYLPVAIRHERYATFVARRDATRRAVQHSGRAAGREQFQRGLAGVCRRAVAAQSVG